MQFCPHRIRTLPQRRWREPKARRPMANLKPSVLASPPARAFPRGLTEENTIVGTRPPRPVEGSWSVHARGNRVSPRSWSHYFPAAVMIPHMAATFDQISALAPSLNPAVRARFRCSRHETLRERPPQRRGGHRRSDGDVPAGRGARSSCPGHLSGMGYRGAVGPCGPGGHAGQGGMRARGACSRPCNRP